MLLAKKGYAILDSVEILILSLYYELNGGKQMKKKKITKALSTVLVLSLSFSVNFGKTDVNAMEGNETVRICREVEVEKSIEDVVQIAEYYKASTSKTDWKKYNGEYEYPIDASDEEWKKFDDHIEMIKACNIPDKLLQNMDTEELLNLTLEYPLLGDMYSYDTNDKGIMAVATQFNGFEELVKRSDLGEVLYKKYINMDFTKKTDEYTLVTNAIVIESLLTQNYIISNYDNVQQKKIFEKFRESLSEKIKLGIPSKLLNIMENSDIFKKLMKYTDKIDMYASDAKGRYYVKTPKGTKVKVTKEKYEGDVWSKIVTNYYKKTYPKAKILSSADNRYNCHSYAWYKASTKNRYWMNYPTAYMRDGSYSYVGTKATATGQKVAYKYQKGPTDNCIHSGIAVNKTGTIKSKWGQAPLMQHNVKYSPYEGKYTLVQYYKKK